MARSIEDVHLVLNILSLGSVVELHHRRGDGDTTLLLNVHPVAGGRLLNLIAFHGTGNLYLSAKEQEFLCQRGLTGIGVRNNCKRSSSFDLLIHRIMDVVLLLCHQFINAFLQRLFPIGNLYAVGLLYLRLVKDGVGWTLCCCRILASVQGPYMTGGDAS